ncbi:hypothetical protein EVAR_9332_1 [Eumeta japonica]|uniref:Uncharacterized protein n=1 Tax=Eumeta variegata TaxID=151549 RepID=A0A4C1TNV3_EUMVA|nr:hypothetical protein EVAR_9332_1 [Eumeta japonica]
MEHYNAWRYLIGTRRLGTVEGTICARGPQQRQRRHYRARKMTAHREQYPPFPSRTSSHRLCGRCPSIYCTITYRS